MTHSSTTVVLHMIDLPQFINSFQTICLQTAPPAEIIILQQTESAVSPAELDKWNTGGLPVRIIKAGHNSTGSALNDAFKAARTDNILYMDNSACEILLKRAAIELFELTLRHHPAASLVYSDYELSEDNVVKEIHLLKHHRGRVRDNQDYGRVFSIRKSALAEIGYTDESLKFNTLYDMRLKLSEKNELVHIANRYAGSLYQIKASAKSHDVFDYLKSGKEVQLEAEQVVTGHLRRIGACLEAGAFYTPRPEAPADSSLKASVIIPVNHRPEFIGAAIESVQAQTVQDIEAIVVVNGGPEDPTVTEVKRYMPGGDRYDAAKPAVQLLVYDINNLGLCLNRGADFARGEYYVQLDSDDRLKPDAVDKILQVFAADPNIGMVIGSYEVWQLDDSGNYSRLEELPVVTHDEWTEENGRNNLLRINGAGAPRSIPIALIRELGFSVNDEPFARNYGEDYNMVLRISERHRIGRVWEAIYEVVRHAGGTDHSIDQQTIDRNDEAKDYMRVRAIQRRQQMNKTNVQ